MNILELSDNFKFIYTADPDQEAELRRLGGIKLGDTNRWEFPSVYSTLAQLERSFGPVQLSDGLVASGLQSPYGFNVNSQDVQDDRLYQYQKEAVSYLWDNPNHGAILALSPGLGKTFTAISAANIIDVPNVLVVCPLSLIHNWIAEIEMWANFKANNCHGTVPMSHGWNVTNYETVVSNREAYRKLRPNLLIIDESIMVKNRNSLRSKAMLMLSRNSGRVWLLSGSPVSKYADDLYMQLNIAEPNAFRSYWRFANTYCFIQKTIWGDKVAGTRPNIDFRSEFRDLMFVRNQREVLPELPSVLHEQYTLEMQPDQLKMYKSMEKEFLLELEGETLTASTKLAQLTRLQQIISCPESLIPGTSSCKLDMIKTLIGTQTLPMPAIIWVNFKATADSLYDTLRSDFPKLNIQKATGDTDERSKVFDGFQKGEIDILILSIGVGKYGLTLTSAQSATYFDRTFDGDAYVQSLARIHRIGLDHSPVVITLKVPRTTDTLIDLNLSGKMKSIHAISNSDLATLMKGLE